MVPPVLLMGEAMAPVQRGGAAPPRRCRRPAAPGIVWYGVVWYVVVWYVWYGMVWYGVVCYGLVMCCGMLWHSSRP